MLQFRILELMEERGIKKPRIKLLVREGISYGLARKYLNGKKRDIARAHIEIFCRILRCTPNDLFEWVPDAGEVLDDNHPLHRLKGRKDFNLQQELNKLTPDEIRKKFEPRDEA